MYKLEYVNQKKKKKKSKENKQIMVGFGAN